MIAAQRYHLTSLQSYFMLGVMEDGKLRRCERMIATQRYHLTSLQSYSMLGVMEDGKLRRYERMIAAQRWRLTSHEIKRKRLLTVPG